MKDSNSPVMAALIALAAALGLTLTGCSGIAPGELGENQQLLADCPDQPINSFVLVDGSGSGVSEATTAERLESIETIARRTGVCGGTLQVAAFAAGSGATVSIYSGNLTLTTPTDNARLRRVPELVEEVMSDVTTNYEPAIAALTQGGTDITGTYRLLGEQAALHPDTRLEGYIFTDGLNNIGIQIEHALSAEEAHTLAEQVSVPNLPDARLTVAGLGRVAGDPVPSVVIEGLVSFYDALCARTGAAECLSVTDWR